jgi:hypothetical protein
MAKKVLLAKGNVRREFGERAAKIAIDFLGWVEIHPPIKPQEIGTKTIPPEITKPIKLIIPPEEPDLRMPEIESDTIKEIVVKKTRKPRKKK